MFRSTLLTHCARWFDQVAKKRNDYGPLHGLTHVLINDFRKSAKMYVQLSIQHQSGLSIVGLGTWN